MTRGASGASPRAEANPDPCRHHGRRPCFSSVHLAGSIHIGSIGCRFYRFDPVSEPLNVFIVLARVKGISHRSSGLTFRSTTSIEMNRLVGVMSAIHP
jgi:hypothetical protein